MNISEENQWEAIKSQLRVELVDFVDTDLAKAIVMLRALGVTPSEITEHFSLSADAQRYLIEDVEHLSQLFDSYDVNTRETADEKLLRMARQALNIKSRILMDEKQSMSLRNSVATEIYEQVYGKARQRVETVNYNIDAGANMDKLKAGLETIYARLAETAKKKGLLKDETLTGDVIEA